MYRSARKRRRRLSVPYAPSSPRRYTGRYTPPPLSQDRERADKIYRFLIQAFRHGPSVLDMLQLPACYDIFGLCRNVYNENHLLTEFLRFSETPGGILVSRIGPKNDIMTLWHLTLQTGCRRKNWVIYDENHKRAAVHPAGRSWFLVNQPLEPNRRTATGDGPLAPGREQTRRLTRTCGVCSAIPLPSGTP